MTETAPFSTDAPACPVSPAAPEPRPAWGSLWRLIQIQSQNAFNDKVAQFTLLGLAKVFLDRMASDRYAHIVSALLVLPLLFFAPVAGWLSDRFSKRHVVMGCSISQVVLLVLIGISFQFGWFWFATSLFGVLAMQAALFQPAKGGIVKEYVGVRHLAVASGWTQMTGIVALVAGQWVGGRMFEYYYRDVYGGETEWMWKSACIPTLILAGLALIPVVLAWQMVPTPAHSTEKFRMRILTDHFLHMGDLLRIRKLRLTAMGVSFFWFAATMLTLILIQLATEIEPNAASQAERSGMLLAFVGAGVALGSVFVALTSANRIELGLVPLGGLGMALGCGLTVFVDPGGIPFRLLMLMIGATSAVFLVPLNAYLQDLVEPQVRGRMLASAGLMDSLAMMTSILVQLAFMKAGMSVTAQLVVLGVLCLVTAVYVVRIIPQNFLRFTVLGVIRIIYRVRTLHADRVPETGGVLLIANHMSYVDALLISAACERPVRFTAFESFFHNPMLRGFLLLFGVVPISNKRAKDAIVTLAETLKGGDVVCVFAEGQITRTGMMNEVRKGFELIARRGGTPVIPVFMDNVWGSIFSYERGVFVRKRPRRFPVDVTVAFGEPVPAESASAAWAAQSMGRLSAEAMQTRRRLQERLDVSVAAALGKSPWRLAVADGEGEHDRLSRALLFAQARHLSRRWREFPVSHMAVALPRGNAAVVALLAIRFAGKTPVYLPPDLTGGTDGAPLRDLLEAEGIRSVVSSSAQRSAHPDFPWPQHFLYLNAEMEDLDDLHLLGDVLFCTLAPLRLVRLRLERHEVAGSGAGFIARDAAGRPRLTMLSDREILTQVEMLHSTALMQHGDSLLCGAELASVAGFTGGLWHSLIHRFPLLLLPPALPGPATLTAWLHEFQPTLAMGDAALACGLAAIPADVPRTLRSFLTWSESGEAIPESAGAALSAATGALACPGLTDESAGLVLAVSMPDPPVPTSTAEPQEGRRAGSPGRPLPGFAVQPAEGALTFYIACGRSVTRGGLSLTADGFLLPARP